MHDSADVVSELFDADRPLRIADQGNFYVGGAYDVDESGLMSGQMYTEYQVPADRRYEQPLVLIHGGGQTGAGFWSTPDGRKGWASYFVSRGFAVYVVDAPGRGRSQGHAGEGTHRPADSVARLMSDTAASGWPQALRHTQWPGGANPGSETFDSYYASQVPGFVDRSWVELAAREAGSALLERIGPAVLIAHSQGAPLAWQIADARPDLTHAIVAVEPNGPPVYDVTYSPDDVWYAAAARARPWGIASAPLSYVPAAESSDDLVFELRDEPDGHDLVRGWQQAAPARQLVNISQSPVLVLTAEASYHAPYDHLTSAYLTQAGVENTFIRLGDEGIRGNGHMMLLESNNLDVAAVIEGWILGR